MGHCSERQSGFLQMAYELKRANALPPYMCEMLNNQNKMQCPFQYRREIIMSQVEKTGWKVQQLRDSQSTVLFIANHSVVACVTAGDPSASYHDPFDDFALTDDESDQEEYVEPDVFGLYLVRDLTLQKWINTNKKYPGESQNIRCILVNHSWLTTKNYAADLISAFDNVFNPMIRKLEPTLEVDDWKGTLFIFNLSLENQPLMLML